MHTNTNVVTCAKLSSYRIIIRTCIHTLRAHLGKYSRKEYIVLGRCIITTNNENSTCFIFNHLFSFLP